MEKADFTTNEFRYIVTFCYNDQLHQYELHNQHKLETLLSERKVEMVIENVLGSIESWIKLKGITIDGAVPKSVYLYSENHDFIVNISKLHNETKSFKKQTDL